MKSVALIGYKGNIGTLIVNEMNFIKLQFDLDNISEFFSLSECDIVIHLGEHSSPNISLDKSLDNINSTIKIVKHSEKIGVKHFIYASSHRRYGSWENYIKNNQKIEGLSSISYYGNAKAFVEDSLKLWSEKSEMKFSVLRIGTILQDHYTNEELEKINGEWKNKYKHSRVKGEEFITFLEEIINKDKRSNFSIYNIIPQESILNNVFNGKNFHNN